MQGGVTYNSSTLLSGGINVNTTGNIQALNVQVTENGERTITPPEGVDGYAPITIDTNVPIPEPVLDTLNVTSNGTYTPPSGVDGYDEVNVNVPQPTPVLDDITITTNGTYTPPSGVDGYDEITVNVSQDVAIQPLTRTITTNGTTVINASDLNVDGFDPVTITTAVDGYTIKTLANTPIPIASFNDGTSNPLKSLTASIDPMQAGSGDPSPTNVRPIIGWSGTNVSVTRNNLCDFANKTITESAYVINNVPVCLPQGSYVLSFDFLGTTSSSSFRIDDKNGNSVFSTNKGVSEGRNTVSISLSQTGFYVKYYSNAVGEYSNFQIEQGSTPTTYEPYAGTTYTIPFTDSQGQSVEVFGGSVDIVNGVVTPCPYYASYNGEQLTGEWISDRDVYTPNTSPTIGAQVVNIGATDTSFNTQPTSIKSLDGVNNVFASTGDVEELKYFANL